MNSKKYQTGYVSFVLLFWGTIYKIDSYRIVTNIFDGKDYRDASKSKLEDNGRFVRPGTYNKADNSIYFATSTGFYRASVSEKGKLQNVRFLFNPSLSWEREPLGIGNKMAIEQIEITYDNKLLSLTSSDGFGIYNGQKLTMFK